MQVEAAKYKYIVLANTSRLPIKSLTPVTHHNDLESDTAVVHAKLWLFQEFSALL